MATRAERKKLRRLTKSADCEPWDNTCPGDLEHSEYVALAKLLPDDPEICKMARYVQDMFDDMRSKIARRVVKVLIKAMKVDRTPLTEEFTAKLIDEVSIFYENTMDIPNGMIRVLPLMQLYSRGPGLIHRIHGHENYKELDRAYRNEFVAAWICEKYSATLFSICNESQYTPALVAVIETEDSDARLRSSIKTYPNRTPEEQRMLTAICQLKPYTS